jgi:dTDP-4-dehydrorhamnose reductase
MKILICGSRGQLGRSLIQALRGHKLWPLARERLDITRLEHVTEAVAAFAPHLVINAAAYNDVDAAESEIVHAYRVNALGPRNLALATARAEIALVHVSTDYVFDGSSERPYHEYDLPRPLSVYGRSKLAGEQAVRELNPRHYVVRTAWMFHAEGRNFLNTMRSLADRHELKAVNDQIGSPTYAPHLADAIARLVRTEAYGTYHLAGQGGATRFEMARLMFSLLGIDVKLLPVAHTEFPATAARPRYSVIVSIQEPRIELPSWQEEIGSFVRALI